MKILITGFEPFSNNKINPSELVINELRKDYDVLLLPVSYHKAPIILNNTINKIKPDIIISLGLASNRDKISLELIGINYMGSNISDNDGILIKGQKINDDLDDGLITNFNLNKLLDKLKEANIDCSLSTSAGTYICNLVYFTSLNYTKNSLFIHLPNLLYSNIEHDVKALEIIIKNLLES